VTKRGNQRLDDARLHMSSLTLVEAINDDNEGGDIKNYSSRDKLLKWLDNEFTELDVDRLFEDKWVVVDSCSNKLPRGGNRQSNLMSNSRNESIHVVSFASRLPEEEGSHEPSTGLTDLGDRVCNSRLPCPGSTIEP